MGEAADTPTFEEWVHYCFTQGHEDFESCELDRGQRFLLIQEPTLAAYIVRLFRNPEFIADRYTDDQIAQGVWFIFGVASGYFYGLRDEVVEEVMQIACIESVESIYLQLFDRVCCKRGSDPDGDYINALAVDIALYMIWDMDGIEYMLIEHQHAHLLRPGLQVLENILLKSRTSTCMISALHGLGHLTSFHPQACKRIVDRFLKTRKAPAWVRNYAKIARTGGVQ